MRLRLSAPILAALLGAPLPLAAQDWFTPEACLVGEAVIDRNILTPGAEARWEAAAAQIPNGTGKLWRITAAGGEVSHLWGTYHVPDPAILDLPDALREVIAAARVVALEFDPLADSPAELRRSYDQNWMWLPFPAEPDPRTDIPQPWRDYIYQRAETFGWMRDYLPQMTDAGVLSLLLADPCADYLSGFLPGQDYYIAQQAWLGGAQVTGLQKPWEFGDQLNEPHRAAAARAAVLSYALYLGPESVEKGVRETSFALYREGRIGLLDAWSSEWLRNTLGEARGRETEALANGYLLIERNAMWMDALRPLLDEGGALVAVGASHLPGDLGLVAMLRDAGYRAERVTLPGERP
ncbi:TraB/GumN family protein [Pseudogemmobacter humi]|uniref:TraB family protein n=1 Tax=Pseudogemmobacter humi TaxID=2483812 RepID=A0A3P5XP67_9RHOB|nr:TraB/GumN family protein [Pseudogemmobacter humi]VDC30560.1 TraB family protein [Pseudogemmobacter humi]